MTSIKLNLTIVGAFVVAALVTLVVSLAVLAGRTGPTDEYHTVYSNVVGLKFGSQVLFEGYPIGQVEEVEPVMVDGRPRFRVNFNVAKDWQIPEDSVARSESSGLLAPQTIAISAGRSTKMLAPGSMVPPGENVGLFESISSISGNVDQITEAGILPLIDNANRQVTKVGEMLDKDVQQILDNVNKVMGEAAVRLPAILERADRASVQLEQASARINELFIPERVAAIDQLIFNVDAASQSLRHTSGQLERLAEEGGDDLRVGLHEFRHTMEAISRHSDSFAQNLDSASRYADEFMLLIRNNPSLVLRSPDYEDEVTPPLRRNPER